MHDSQLEHHYRDREGIAGPGDMTGARWCFVWRDTSRLLLLITLYPAAVVAQVPLPDWTATEEMRIDGRAEDLTSINWVAVSQHGDIAIAQPQDHRVLFYSRDGKLIGKFGRLGEGPGEFRGVGPLRWIGDTLQVYDYALRRSTWVRPGGSVVRTVRDASPVSAGPSDPVPCVNQGGGRRLTNPFCARTVRNAAVDSSLFSIIAQSTPTSTRGRYTITVLRRNGDTVFSESLTAPSVRIPKWYSDSMIDVMTALRGPDARAFFQRTMPAYFQPVRVVFFGTDGTIWVMYWAEPRGGTGEYLVLDANGKALATVSLPRTLVLQGVSRSTVWGVLTDDDGVDSVVRYHVRH